MIFTSYFNNQFRVPLRSVSVCLDKPDGLHCERFLALAPTSKMIELANSGRFDKFSELYYSHVLTRLDPFATYHELDSSVLLGWEKPGGFCHRHIVASWLEHAVGLPVLELDDATAAALATWHALKKIA